jgi:hypothetical protein
VPPRRAQPDQLADFALNVNGSREDGNNFLLDGVYNGDPKLNTFGVNTSVDAIQGSK